MFIFTAVKFATFIGEPQLVSFRQNSRYTHRQTERQGERRRWKENGKHLLTSTWLHAHSIKCTNNKVPRIEIRAAAKKEQQQATNTKERYL